MDECTIEDDAIEVAFMCAPGENHVYASPRTLVDLLTVRWRPTELNIVRLVVSGFIIFPHPMWADPERAKIDSPTLLVDGRRGLEIIAKLWPLTPADRVTLTLRHDTIEPIECSVRFGFAPVSASPSHLPAPDS